MIKFFSERCPSSIGLPAYIIVAPPGLYSKDYSKDQQKTDIVVPQKFDTPPQRNPTPPPLSLKEPLYMKSSRLH